MKVDPSVKEYVDSNNLLRGGGMRRLYVGVKGGGCSGLQYVFQVVEFDPKYYIAIDEIVCTDPKSAIFLNNTVLKYKQSIEASILVVENPSAVNTCGCGESFSL